MIEINKNKLISVLKQTVEKKDKALFQEVKTDLERSPKDGDCFVSRPDKLEQTINLPAIIETPITNEVNRLILANITGEEETLNINNTQTKLTKVFSSKRFFDNKRVIETFKKQIDQFKTGIIDPKIKEIIIKRIASNNGDDRNIWGLHIKLNELLNLLDLDKSLHDHSYSFSNEFVKHLQKYVNFDKIFDEIKQTPISQPPKTYEAKLLKNEMELDPLKTYIKNNYKQEPELTKYLYEKYYLSRLSLDVKTICRKISNEFSTKLFVEDESNPTSASMVYDELTRSKAASNGKFIAPPIINLSRYESYFIEHPNHAGYADDYSSPIHIAGDGNTRIMNTLRHELTHVNDPYLDSLSGTINDIDIDKIIVRKPLKENGDLGDLIWSECKYKDEFFNAGLTPYLIHYAYKDAREFKAVASEGDYSKYSPKFKQLLLNIGMPEYIFKLKPCNDFYVDNANYVATIKQMHPELKTMEDVIAHMKKQSKNHDDLIKIPRTLRESYVDIVT